MEEYLKAAELLATCPPERVDLVRETLRAGGIEVPTTPVEPSEHRAYEHKNSGTTRIDMECVELLRELRQSTGLTMVKLASQLIKEGARIMDMGGSVSDG